MSANANRGVVYQGAGKVSVESLDYPTLALGNRKCEHGVILKVVSTNICGSDQHMVRGRTTAPQGLVLGHEITGLVVEAGRDVEFIKVGDIVSVPFNIACGRCRNCKEGKTGICLNVNPARPGAAYGYVDMGGWTGGQTDYVMVPYADFNLLKFPDADQAMEKIRDLTLLSDIFPTGFHGCVTAGVGPGSTVYIAGAGPVGLAAAVSAQLLGAACVIVGDMIPERLQQAESFGCETIDLRQEGSMEDKVEVILGEREVDCFVDCVGFEAHGCGCDHGREQPATVLNSAMALTRAGGQIGIPGLYVTEDPGAEDEAAKVGALSMRFGLGWAKSHSLHTGQCPVMKYHRPLMQAILFGRVNIADAVNVQVISLEEAPQGYADFDGGAAKKFVIDPHAMVRNGRAA
ncbi:MAG: formaldehyde dehydrogenase, glutathione-independent [Cobetia sp.]|jgi:glutathione-independent formaldehyde dehydrogenase|uniref:Formaldehyde dehydrogenase, glutathione-independent n=1 Tax=Cobetia amphilecti TaxID=1055104 RepID=A0ABT6UPL2_9GAMM|nr:MULTISPECIES: formaldehyde dehydrogenase, glutathione-independent [Cobetia]MBR9756278.1 formaldehyde dehydrogenase, glutathione-independent [Gammaproteobacteria bacterium]NVN56535.1 formaldehyde dehydrogenase, glutathione-independent [bacterium Scap17]TCJ26693.1 formaldehyde dehydrogenase, glutathione-independent [Halomonas sp. GDM18]KPM80854.1 aldehyde dismutase [Cobetia sp. UCD-24C]MBE2167236.1 formaldehyde dehydrogenase, glutathione-independent [Cobetia sp. 2AS1]|tara:strand:- start:16353 stop:17561 length:1209 start_codon:yes stop_codon:yes gene_type:complete